MSFDICAFHGVQLVGSTTLHEGLMPPELCTGIQKLVQWFVGELLCEVGTQPFEPLRGTSLMQELRSGRIRSELDAAMSFGLAVGMIKAAAGRQESATMPVEERFADAVLESVTITPGAASLRIKLESRAGDARLVMLPISTIAG